MDQLPPTDAAREPADGTATGATPAIAATSSPAGTSFRFGEPEAVLDRREFLSFAESRWNGRWYEPPIPLDKLARTRFMSPHHASAVAYKVNQLARFFVPSRFLDLASFRDYATNFLFLGTAYLQRVDNLANRPMRLEYQPTVYMRRGRDGRFFWVPGWNDWTELAPGSIFQLRETDLTQEIYGLPEWLPALQSGLLNEAATIFRRRYYVNGSHAGYILYIGEEKFSATDSEKLQDAMAQSKGPGNFRNLFLHIPGGKNDGVKVIPVGEAAAKDEFLNMKAVTRDDLLAAHRVPPVLIGVVPQVTGGFGKPGEAADVFHSAEIEPLQLKMAEVNAWLGYEAVAFRAYEKQAAPAQAERSQAAA